MTTVFISYSHSDREFVDWLADAMKASGVDVWIDKWMIKVGDSITGKINEGIGASDFLVLVLSHTSANSKWVRQEINAALIRNIEAEKHAFILPALLERCDIPPLLQDKLYANFTVDREQGLTQLLEVIRPEDAPPELIEIPGGDFLYGKDKERHYLPTYYIAKYPVTHREYKRFVDATGHRVPHGESDWAKPYNWSPATRTYPLDKANHPVVLVSWDDAQAYCRWLSEVTSKPYSLPSESEWEKAARGTDGRKWPWGNRWDPGKCNSEEAGIKGTTPVDRYPDGASPYGVMDMVGNVWEWTSSQHKEYKGQYYLKAGSWWSEAEGTRCAARGRGFAKGWLDAVGFRVVLSQLS